MTTTKIFDDFPQQMPKEVVQTLIRAGPANAEAEIKKSAAYVSPHHEVARVLDILERLSL
jgi:hypothetical protein